MTFVYICDFCRAGRHYACEENTEPLTEEQIAAGFCGGGHCVCSHTEEKERSKFEQGLWAAD